MSTGQAGARPNRDRLGTKLLRLYVQCVLNLIRIQNFDMKSLRILLIVLIVVAVASQCCGQTTDTLTTATDSSATDATTTSGSAVVHASLGMLCAAAFMTLLQL
ncbi:hypothetical protein Bbelb_326840 [Branchiostoma belcheri]|nr:hypothetical protein Bbelb_326840 [Branchiostoma belcheri]